MNESGKAIYVSGASFRESWAIMAAVVRMSRGADRSADGQAAAVPAEKDPPEGACESSD